MPIPNNDFISNILDIKDLIITNVESSSEEMHIYFNMKRRDHVCTCCGTVINKVHDYRPSIIKYAPIMGKNLYYLGFRKCKKTHSKGYASFKP